MSYTKIVKLMCDGPNCRSEVYSSTAANARDYAKKGQGWKQARKYGLDFCSESCLINWRDVMDAIKEDAENIAEVPHGTISKVTMAGDRP